MTITPASDLIARSRWAAINGKKLHLDVAHAEWIAQHPELQALLARVAAEETARLCLARKPPTDDSPPLPLFKEREALSLSPTNTELTKPQKSASSRFGSAGAPIAANTSCGGMTPALVQAAASAQALDQALMLKSQSRRAKRSRRISPPMPDRQRPKPRPTLVSPPC